MAREPEVLDIMREAWGRAFLEDLVYWALTATLVLLFITAFPVYMNGPDRVEWRKFFLKCVAAFLLTLAGLAWFGFDLKLAAVTIRLFFREHYFIVAGMFGLGISFQYTLYYVLIPRMVGIVPFVAEDWINGNKLARTRMVHDLIKKHHMAILSRKEIVAMLGEPDFTREEDNALVYYLDCERRIAVLMPKTIKEMRVKMVLE